MKEQGRRLRGAPPVDQGWAWVVVLAAFMHLFILIGLARSSGIIFAELVDAYGGKASTAAVMVALQTGISLFAAPIVTAAVELTSCRTVCYVGSVMFSLSFICASFFNSIEEIAICYGIFAGIGYGCCLTPTPVIVGRYFDKKRSLANGLTFSGTGLGNVVLPALVFHLIDRYHLHGAMLILGAFALQTSIFASLYRPLALYSKPVTDVFQNHFTHNHNGNEKLLLQHQEEVSSGNQSLQKDQELLNDQKAAIINDDDEVDRESLKTAAEVGSECDEYFSPRSCMTRRGVSVEESCSKYGSALDLAMISSNIDIPMALAHLDPVVEEPAVATDSEKLRKLETLKRNLTRLARKAFYTRSDDGHLTPLISFALLKNAEFAASMLGVVAFLNVFFLSMILPPHCHDLGLSKADAATVLSIQGAADMLGRLFQGFTGDCRLVKRYRRWTLLLYTSVVALLTLMLPLCRTFRSLVAVLVPCAFAFGAFVALNPVVVTDIVGWHNFARAWGMQLFFEGFTLTTSPVIIGALRDYTQSYDAGFVYISISCSIACVCVLVSNLIGTKMRKKKNGDEKPDANVVS